MVAPAVPVPAVPELPPVGSPAPLPPEPGVPVPPVVAFPAGGTEALSALHAPNSAAQTTISMSREDRELMLTSNNVVGPTAARPVLRTGLEVGKVTAFAARTSRL